MPGVATCLAQDWQDIAGKVGLNPVRTRIDFDGNSKTLAIQLSDELLAASSDRAQNSWALHLDPVTGGDFCRLGGVDLEAIRQLRGDEEMRLFAGLDSETRGRT
jgi:hypothetical protein